MYNVEGLCKWFLIRNFGFYFFCIKMGQVFFIHPCQFFFHIHVSVQVDIAVGRMVIGLMEIQEVFVGQVRDAGRISAGFYAVRSVREQGVEGFTLQDIVCGGEGSFHLVVYNTVVGQRAVFAFEMIAPAFLTEDFVVFVNVRVEYGVHVDMHQVLEVGIVGAGYRVHGFIRVGHSI